MGYYDTWNQPSARMLQQRAEANRQSSPQPYVDQGEWQQEDPGAPWRTQGARQSLPANIATNALWEQMVSQPQGTWQQGGGGQPGPVYGPRTAVDEWMANTPWATPQGGGTPPIPSGQGGLPLGLETYTDPKTGIMYYRDAAGEWRVASQGQGLPDTTMTPYQQAQIDLARSQQTYQQQQPNYDLQIAQMQQQNQQAQLQWQREQWGQELAQEQKNYLAQLGANPRSWLEYASAAGQPPVIQPWMVHLMSQDYSQLGGGAQSMIGGGGYNADFPREGLTPEGRTPAPGYIGGLTPEGRTPAPGYIGGVTRENVVPVGGTQALQNYNMYSAGQMIPGWNAADMSNMPQLMTPSAQYYARMGPTANQQYMGYEQARTGSRPEETQFRLWNMAPPGGSNRGLTQTR